MDVNYYKPIIMTKTIKILGTGCSKCQTLANVVKDVINENNLDATVEKVEDLKEIMEFNVMITPAMVVDNMVKIKGQIPTKADVLALLS